MDFGVLNSKLISIELKLQTQIFANKKVNSPLERPATKFG